MGLDIYTGTLTRYYMGNWKSATQQWAEANGYSFSRITPQGDKDNEEPQLSTSEMQKIMENWQEQILAALASPERPAYAAWTEDNVSPYYTAKPDWDAFGALLLYAAARTYQEPLPKTVEKNWDFEKHPLIRRISGDEKMLWSLFIGANLWLPLEDGLAFNCSGPVGQEITISTAGALKMELDQINSIGWKANEETILSWKDMEGYPADGELRDGRLTNAGITAHTAYDTESLAKFAFSIFWKAARFSLENRVPILLDF